MNAVTKLSNADTALLGLLCEEPMHPWQIEKVVRERDMRLWTDLSQATIYKQLSLLLKTGLVECRQKIGRGRLRKIYTITRLGRERLLGKLRELLSEPQPTKWPVDLGTYNLHLLPAGEAVASLKRYRKKLEEGIACYRRLIEYLESCQCRANRCALARRPIYLFKAEICWVDDLVEQLRRKP